MNDTVKKFADEINSILPDIKVGTLCFFGVWFGRPHDNRHHVVKADDNDDVLKITFNEGETLEVSDPTSCDFSSTQFEIRHAHKVLWKWYSYGLPKIDENLYYYDFEVNDNKVRMTANVSWFTEQQVPQVTEPAVKMY